MRRISALAKDVEGNSSFYLVLTLSFIATAVLELEELGRNPISP